MQTDPGLGSVFLIFLPKITEIAQIFIDNQEFTLLLLASKKKSRFQLETCFHFLSNNS